MKSQLREQAINLRLTKQLGYTSIAKLVPVAKSTLSRWLKDFPLTEERITELRRENLKNNEAKIERYINTRRRNRELKFKDIYNEYLNVLSNISQREFFVAGLMLYIAEGTKSNYYNVSIANTDVKIIKFFIKWLEEFFQVPRSKLHIQLHLYPNMDLDKEKEFWKSQLKFNETQFYKTYVSKLKNKSFSYSQSFRHGTCNVVISSGEIKMKIMAAIGVFVDQYLKNF